MIALLWSKPALYCYALIALVLAYTGWHHHVYQSGWDAAISQVEKAKMQGDATDAKASTIGVTTYASQVAVDVPAADAAADSLNVLCSTASGVQLQPATGTAHGASRKIGDGGKGKSKAPVADPNAITLEDWKHDLHTCAGELDKLDGLQAYERARAPVSQ